MYGDKNISLEWIEMRILCVQQTYEIWYGFMGDTSVLSILNMLFWSGHVCYVTYRWKALHSGNISMLINGFKLAA